MKNIRNGVFETNSSSSHSMVISDDKDSIIDSLPIINGKIIIYPGVFDYNYDNGEDSTYSSATEKASYLLTHSNNKELSILREAIKRWATETKQQYTEIEFKDTVEGITKEDNYEYEHGYVSGGEYQAEKCLKSVDETFNFIFNTNSYLHIGYDG